MSNVQEMPPNQHHDGGIMEVLSETGGPKKVDVMSGEAVPNNADETRVDENKKLPKSGSTYFREVIERTDKRTMLVAGVVFWVMVLVIGGTVVGVMLGQKTPEITTNSPSMSPLSGSPTPKPNVPTAIPTPTALPLGQKCDRGSDCASGACDGVCECNHSHGGRDCPSGLTCQHNSMSANACVPPTNRANGVDCDSNSQCASDCCNFAEQVCTDSDLFDPTCW